MADEREVGLVNKYAILRHDGSSGPGGKHEFCEYFVLDLMHDPYALPAIREYAHACATTHPVLSRELHAACDVMSNARFRSRE